MDGSSRVGENQPDLLQFSLTPFLEAEMHKLISGFSYSLVGFQV